MSTTSSRSTTTRTATRTTTPVAAITAFGGPERLHLSEVELLAPGAHQVQIAVAAVAVNPVDLSTRAGMNIPTADARFPMVLGWDVTGTVTAVGDGVTDREVGDRVATMVFQPLDQRGTYAAHLTLDSALLAQVPDRLTLERAATVPLAGLTAAGLLAEAALTAGATLLVNGPLGAVGRIAVALAVHAGLTVVGVVRPEQTDALRARGAVPVERGDFTSSVLDRYPGGVDAAIDVVGGDTGRAALDAVREGGRYVTAVPPYIDPSGPFDPERGITPQVFTVAVDPARLSELLTLAADEVIGTAIEHTYPLADAAQAHRTQAAGGLAGRVVLLP